MIYCRCQLNPGRLQLFSQTHLILSAFYCFFVAPLTMRLLFTFDSWISGVFHLHSRRQMGIYSFISFCSLCVPLVGNCYLIYLSNEYPEDHLINQLHHHSRSLLLCWVAFPVFDRTKNFHCSISCSCSPSPIKYKFIEFRGIKGNSPTMWLFR